MAAIVSASWGTTLCESDKEVLFKGSDSSALFLRWDDLDPLHLPFPKALRSEKRIFLEGNMNNPAVMGIEGADRQTTALRLGLLAQLNSRPSQAFCPPLSVVINVQHHIDRLLQAFADHSIDDEFKGFQGTTMLPNEKPFPFSPDFQMDTSFPQKTLQNSLHLHSFQQSRRELLGNLNPFFQDLNLTPSCSDSIDGRWIRHY